MKKIYFLIAILIGTASYGQLVINEIHADPDGSILGDANGDGVRNSTQDEFIEIYNIGAPVNLNGYTISDSVLTRHIFPDVTLNSGEFITVFGGGAPTGFSGIVQTALGGSLGLNNGGDTVTLANADGDIIAQVNYGPEAGANTSIARDPDFTGDFIQHLSHSINPIIFSPHARNDGLATGADLVINEILADPENSILGDANGDGVRSSSGDEFIEIYNIGAPINLNGYTISDSVLTRHIFPDVTLNSGEFITVFGGGTPTGFSGIVQTALSGNLGLNNGGDTVILANADGDIIAQVNYGPEAGANTSIARDPDFTGDFVQHLSHSINPIIFSPDSRNDAIVLNTNTNQLERFKVYPNPTNGEFFINYANSNIINVKIYDLLGKQVYQKNITSNERIRVDNVKSGIYILKINEDGKTSTKKLVVK